MATAFTGNKNSKCILPCNTLFIDDNSIKTFEDAIYKIKNGDILYSELNYMSFIIKVKKIVKYQNGLAFQYDFMLNKFNILYNDSWCYSDYCRFATEDEIKLLKKKVKYHKKKL